MASLKTCLLSKTADEILAAQGQSFALTDFIYLIWGPVVDGDFLPGEWVKLALCVSNMESSC